MVSELYNVIRSIQSVRSIRLRITRITHTLRTKEDFLGVWLCI